jgi:hypothetical protein
MGVPPNNPPAYNTAKNLVQIISVKKYYERGICNRRCHSSV